MNELQINQAAYISYVTSLVDRPLSGLEINELFESIRVMRAQANASEIDNLLFAMKDNKFIEAIKSYRSLTGMGLKESKDAIERYRVNVNHPEAI